MKSNLKHFFAALVFLLSSGLMFGQDIHFSQYYASPMTLNPALTGKFNGEWRVGAIYRSQWAPATKPLFMTPSLHLDFSLLKGKLRKDALGVGVVFYTDRQNGSGIVSYDVRLGLAYHKGFGRNNGTQISLGFEGGYLNRSVNASNTQFADGYTYDPSSPTGYIYTSSSEVVSGKTGIFDFNAGIFGNSKFTKWMTFYAGFAWNHLGRPTETYLEGGSGSTIPWRFVGHGGFEMDVTPKVVLIPGVLYQQQAKAQEANFGITAGYHFKVDPNKGNTTLFAGVWNRMTPHAQDGSTKTVWGEESIIPKLGFEVANFRAGLSLDVPLSKLKYTKNGEVGNSAGNLAASYNAKKPMAFEISLVYIGRVKVPTEDRYIFNPRF